MSESRGILSRTAILAALVFGVALAASAHSAWAADTESSYVAASPDGEQVLFVTGDRLDPRDRDKQLDIYENRDGRTRLVSMTPKGAAGKGNFAVSYKSETEARALLSTSMSFSPEDRDELVDIYELSGDRLTLLTQDSVFPAACATACHYGVNYTAADGRVVYIVTEDALTADDNDLSRDVFSLSNGQVRLVSGGPFAGGADSKNVDRTWPTEDGSAVYFQTDEPLVPEDTDQTFDAYVHTAAGTTLATPWPAPEGSSADQMELRPSKVIPGRFVLYTNQSFDGTPPDAGPRKTYLVEGDQRTLIASGEKHTQVTGESPDGQTVYFTSEDALTAVDTDKTSDIYAWRAGQFELVSIGSRGSVAMSESGPMAEVVKVTTNGDVYFKTADQLVGDDNNGAFDLYVKTLAGDLRLLSVGPDGKAAGISTAQVLEDGLRVIITSNGRMTRDDRHYGSDLFLLEGGALRLLTRPASRQGYANGNDPLLGGHRGADRYLITNGSRLTQDDGDEQYDVYRIDLSEPKPARLLSAADLRILSGPARYVRRGPVTFSFAQAGAKPRFRCSLDGGKPRPCRSPVTYRSLSDGGHRFRVVSTGPGGLGEGVPATRKFIVTKPEPPPEPRRSELHAVSADGRRVLIESSDRLAKADRDDDRDLFIKGLNGRTTLVTRGPGSVSSPYFISEDLKRIIVRSGDSLVASDRDEASDLYLWSGGKPSLLPAGADVTDTPLFAGASDNGRVVAFTTRDSLDAGDTDQADDLYRASPSGVSLVSGGVAAGADVVPAGMSPDGSSFTFRTAEALVPEDTDGGSTLYWASKGQIMPISPGGTLKSYADPRVIGMARDGSTVILSSKRRLVEADTDDSTDIYTWTNGVLDQVSTGPESESAKLGASVPRLARWGSYVDSDWIEPLGDLAISKDASEVMFRTAERLVIDDRDRAQDLYVYRNGFAKLVGPRKGGRDHVSFRGASADLKTVIVQTEDALVPTDRNKDDDLYRVTGRRAERLTAGGPPTRGFRGFKVLWVSKNGKQVAFQTTVKLTRDDRDTDKDLYLSAGGPRPTLLSRYKTPKYRDRIRSFLAGDRGGFFYVATRARLVKADRDDVDDVYRLGGRRPVKVS